MIKKIWNLFLFLSFAFVIASCSKRIEPSVDEVSDYSRYTDLLKAFDLSSIEFEYAGKTITYFDKNLIKYKIECNDYTIIDDDHRFLSLSNSDFFEIDDFVFEYFEYNNEYVKTISKDLIKNNTTVKIIDKKYHLKTSYATFRIDSVSKDRAELYNLDTKNKVIMSCIDKTELKYNRLKESANANIFATLSGYEIYSNKESEFDIYGYQMNEHSNYFLNMELNVEGESVGLNFDFATDNVAYNATTLSNSKGKNVYSCVSKTNGDDITKCDFAVNRYIENEFKIISATEIFKPSGNSTKNYKIKNDLFLCFDYAFKMKRDDYVIKMNYKTIGNSKETEFAVETSTDNQVSVIHKANIKSEIIGYIEVSKAEKRWVVLLKGSSYPFDVDVTFNKKMNNFLINHNYTHFIYGGYNEV